MGSKLIALKNEVPLKPWLPLKAPPAQNPTGLLHPLVINLDCSRMNIDIQSGLEAFVLMLWLANAADATIAINKLIAIAFDFVLIVLTTFSFLCHISAICMLVRHARDEMYRQSFGILRK